MFSSIFLSSSYLFIMFVYNSVFHPGANSTFLWKCVYQAQSETLSAGAQISWKQTIHVKQLFCPTDTTYSQYK